MSKPQKDKKIYQWLQIGATGLVILAFFWNSSSELHQNHAQIDSNTHRIKALEQEMKAVNELAKQVEVIKTMTSSTQQTVLRMEERQFAAMKKGKPPY